MFHDDDMKLHDFFCELHFDGGEVRIVVVEQHVFSLNFISTKVSFTLSSLNNISLVLSFTSKKWSFISKELSFTSMPFWQIHPWQRLAPCRGRVL